MATNAGEFNKTIVTAVGKEMIAKSQGGQNLQITQVVLGDGTPGVEDNPTALTAVKSPKLNVPIADFTDTENGLYTIQFRMSNADVEAGFWLREIGVMAKIDNGEEQLYAYTTATGDGSFIYDKTTPVQERVYNVTFGIGDAENVSVVINSSIIYITQEKFESEMAKHNDSDAAHEPAFTAKFKAHNADTDAHKDFVGATAAEAGVRGMVPAPAAGDEGKFLCADGTFKVAKMTTLELVNLLYPVGIIAEFTNDTNPNDIWPGTTWSKMDAGRVLVAAGTYKEGNDTYTYNLGTKGGEAKHQLTTEELARHTHPIVITSSGVHNHAITLNNYCCDKATANHGWGGDDLSKGTYTNHTDNSGNHTHDTSAGYVGSNAPHENRMPYEVISRWKRTA